MNAARVIFWQVVLSLLVAGAILPVVVLMAPAEGAASVWPYVAGGVAAATFVIIRLFWRRRST